MEITLILYGLFILAMYFYFNSKIKALYRELDDTRPVYTEKDKEGNTLLKNSNGETILKL